MPLKNRLDRWIVKPGAGTLRIGNKWLEAALPETLPFFAGLQCRAVPDKLTPVDLLLTWLSRHVFFPLWELKNRSHRRQYLSELSATQWWGSEALKAQQWERLRAAVSYAFANVPYYSARYTSSGFDGVLRSWHDFLRLPLLKKQDIRANGAALLSNRFAREELVEARTGGSTGTALTVHFDRRCQELRNAAEMRSDRWAGCDIGMQIAALWGNPPAANTLKARLRKLLLLDRVFFLDTMDLNDRTVLDFVRQWRRKKPSVLFGHAHSIYMVATYLQRFGVRDLRPKSIVSTSMMLLSPERALIEKTFDCPVTDRYGCEEVGLIASECEQHSGLHLNVDHMVVEFLRDDGSQAQPGEEANIVVTDLINRGMPLIRYCVGDLGVLSDRICGCGRGLPLMERVTGRRADFLKRPDGSLVAGVSLVERTLTAFPGIEQMQLLQDELRRVCVKIVKDGHFAPESEQTLRRELQVVFGDETTIDIHYVDRLDQTRSGKYRFSICNV
jgi:phenylacetate-CoA ligase